MSTNAGVWIDHHKAVIVLLSDEMEKVQEITAHDGASDLSVTEVTHSYTPRDFVADDKLEHRKMNQLHTYFDEVIKCLPAVKGLVVFGPGEAKREFISRLDHHPVPGRIAKAETTDKLTDPQIVAYVRNHFKH